MLDEKDLQSIQTMIDASIRAPEKRMIAYFDTDVMPKRPPGGARPAHPLPHHPEFPALLRAEQPGGASGAACRQPGGGADGVGAGGTGGPAEGGGGRTGGAGARRGA